MTLEEVKKLKRGDEIFIRAKFVRVFDDGDVLFTHTNTNGDEEVVKTEEYTHSGNVILPSEVQPAPKYDPCRRFKKGDKVRVIKERNGRKTPACGAICPGKSYTVSDDEKDGDVMLRTCNWMHDCISWDWLELVTPVEEDEPYSVEESSDYYSVEKEGNELCTFWKDVHPAPREGAEAECKRLNAEYRKEQNNG